MKNYDYLIGIALVYAVALCVVGFGIVSAFRLDMVGLIASIAVFQAVRVMIRQQLDEYKQQKRHEQLESE